MRPIQLDYSRLWVVTLLALASTLIALAIRPAPAPAASTRAEYVAQVDPICQQARQSQRAVIHAVNSKVKALAKRGFDPQKPSKPIGRLIVHGYDRLAAIERSSDSQIRTVSPAPGDEATAALWLQKRASFTKLLQRGGHLFAHQKQRKSLRLFLRALKTQDEAATIIDQFGFQYCVRILPGT